MINIYSQKLCMLLILGGVGRNRIVCLLLFTNLLDFACMCLTLLHSERPNSVLSAIGLNSSQRGFS